LPLHTPSTDSPAPATAFARDKTTAAHILKSQCPGVLTLYIQCVCEREGENVCVSVFTTPARILESQCPGVLTIYMYCVCVCERECVYLQHLHVFSKVSALVYLLYICNVSECV
jgi:hypothetical protein